MVFNEPFRVFYQMNEFIRSFTLWRLALELGYSEIRSKYRRSILGPFWNTITLAIMIFVLGPIYAVVLNVDSNLYILYLSIGIVSWWFFSSFVSDCVFLFLSESDYITQVNLPYPIYVFKIFIKNLLMFFHNSFIPLFLSIFVLGFGIHIVLYPLFVIFFGLIFLPLGFVIAVFCLRYRDMAPLVNSLLQLLLFATPVFWMSLSNRPEIQSIIAFNPFYYLIDMTRFPFAVFDSDHHFIVNLFLFITFWSLAFLTATKVKSKLVYWI